MELVYTLVLIIGKVAAPGGIYDTMAECSAKAEERIAPLVEEVDRKTQSAACVVSWRPIPPTPPPPGVKS